MGRPIEEFRQSNFQVSESLGVSESSANPQTLEIAEDVTPLLLQFDLDEAIRASHELQQRLQWALEKIIELRVMGRGAVSGTDNVHRALANLAGLEMVVRDMMGVIEARFPPGRSNDLISE